MSDARPLSAPGGPAAGATARVAALDPARERVLLVRRGGAWVLPSVRADGPWFETGAVAAAIEAAFGLRVFLQRCLHGDDNARPAPERLYAGQLLEPPPTGPDLRWTPLDGPAGPAGPPAPVPPRLRAWAAGEPGAQDWERADWLAETAEWVAGVLGRRPDALRQLRTWPRSSVWRVLTAGGPLVLKASPQVFGDEGAVSDALARHFPGAFPAVLGHDPEHRLLLMEELPGLPLDRCGVPDWHTALNAFARIQIRAAGMRGELRRAGCPDLGTDRLRAWTAELLGPRGPVASGAVTGLSGPERTALVGLAPRLDRAWRALAAAGVPETLEHGDFRPGHIVVDHGTPRFFDLSDAAVSHPFFSAVTLLHFEPLPPDGGPDGELRAALRDGYLRTWARAYPDADVAAAFRTALPLAHLHAALVRWFRLLPAMTPRHTWEFMVAPWLRGLLGTLDGTGPRD